MLNLDRWRRMSLGEVILQVALVLLVVFVVWGAVTSAQINLTALGITSGFSFLDRDTGWSYSFSLIERSIDDTYARTLTIGFLNTLFVGLISIFSATMVGFLVGAARDSKNPGLSFVSLLYVQFFRNIPLILQIVFIYSVLIHFPSPRKAMTLLDTIFLSNRGLMLPTLNMSGTAVLCCSLISLAIAVLLIWRSSSLWRGFAIWALATTVLFTSVALALLPEGASFLDRPALKGLRFRGGVTLSTELLAMLVGILLYGSAYIAEVVRGGLNEVPKGLTEAGQALGMSTFAVWYKIKVPIALRSIMPPLGNQWIFIMKATTVGVAIGFSDLFYIVSTSITQSGQTLELIFILMAAFLLVNFTLAQIVNLINARLALRES